MRGLAWRRLRTTGSGTITASYTAGPAGDLAQYGGAPSSSTSVSYLYYDDHGNLIAEADSTGTRTAAHSYDPLGAPLDTQPANSTVHRFTGRWDKQYDTTSNLIQMGARPYDPMLGRFYAVDPIDGGSLNNYDYSGQDPFNGYDLDGTQAIPIRPIGLGWGLAALFAAGADQCIKTGACNGSGAIIAQKIRDAIARASASGSAQSPNTDPNVSQSVRTKVGAWIGAGIAAGHAVPGTPAHDQPHVREPSVPTAPVERKNVRPGRPAKKKK